MCLLFKHGGEIGDPGLNAQPHATKENENDTKNARGKPNGTRLLQLRQNIVKEKLLNQKNIAMAHLQCLANFMVSNLPTLSYKYRVPTVGVTNVIFNIFEMALKRGKTFKHVKDKTLRIFNGV